MTYKTPIEILDEINTKYKKGDMTADELRTVMETFNECYYYYDDYQSGDPVAEEQIKRFYEAAEGIIEMPKSDLEEAETKHTNSMGH